MPTDDSNAMVPADPAPTTEKKGKKKLVWSTRTQLMAIGTAIASTTYVLPTDAPLLALQQGVANVMYDHYYQDPKTSAWVPVQPLYPALFRRRHEFLVCANLFTDNIYKGNIFKI